MPILVQALYQSPYPFYRPSLVLLPGIKTGHAPITKCTSRHPISVQRNTNSSFPALCDWFSMPSHSWYGRSRIQNRHHDLASKSREVLLDRAEAKGLLRKYVADRLTQLQAHDLNQCNKVLVSPAESSINYETRRRKDMNWAHKATFSWFYSGR